MNILVYGVGGIGGFFGGKLALTDHHVTFLARGKHFEAIHENGLLVKSWQGDFTVRPNMITDDVASIGVPDLVLLGVKSWQIPEAIGHLRPHLLPHTVILPLQNGVDNTQRITKLLTSGHVLAGCCNLISYIEAPGIIRHAHFIPSITFGEIDDTLTQRVLDIKELFEEAGIANNIAFDIEKELWKKFLFICPISGVGALTRLEINTICAAPYLFKMVRDAAYEILELARTMGIALSQRDVERTLETLKSQEHMGTTSMQRDIIHGRPSELEHLTGYVVHQAKKRGIFAPTNELIYECLLPSELEVRRSSD
ncbi:ketopantoate reductase [Flagellimonas taeanensis]|uniref:2-dehydropantoate 2-reductase n=1 Tax=Flagellimonas taeanensis TaxID=1005926 RepID=A0A1M6X941_9FLAO|nr:2-dehydropantoate 2-reductase [Allomuricauda taeanensis]SFB96881.1 ketopantoate reductase [Allomuricauda taeanensis]SHL02389.1 ketopantoate reductase [Allomuricauda taeanensis]